MAGNKKNENSPKHRVDMTLKSKDIAKAGAAVKFKVYGENATLLGTIEIGQGTFGWKATKKQSFNRIDWTSFATKLNEGL